MYLLAIHTNHKKSHITLVIFPNKNILTLLLRIEIVDKLDIKISL